MAPSPLTVRLKPSFRGSGQAVGVLILLFCSVMFVIGGLADPASAGGVVFLLLGVTGVVAFGAVLAVVAGHLLGRRPLLVLDGEGVRVPAKWPLPRSRDRFLPWGEVAAVCAWTEGIPGGKGLAHRLAFLPAEDSPHARATSGAEMLRVKTQGLPGVPVLRWSVPVLDGWTVPQDRVIEQVRALSEAPFEDRRIGLPKRRRVIRPKKR
ncbi:hypothetical protein [Actinocorallia populi]|uniref:hypothetical protein n=1 Tax=Actinocorallia populi TaxID=2079200 RepID=UPI000D09304A|nr:hypothetical protein [Actinocorallia populi]